MFESWTQFFEELEAKILRQEPILIEELVPKVRHLPLPRDSEEPLKAYLRTLAHDCAGRHGVEIFFLRGRVHYAITREELMRLFRRHESRLRSQGKRFVTIAHKIQKATRKKSESTQFEFNFETGSIDAPNELLRNTESVSPPTSTNVVPIRPEDEATLWSQMVAAFTSGNPDSIPPFNKVIAEFVRRQLGIAVPDVVFRDDYVPLTKLRSIYDDLVVTMTEMIQELPKDEAGGEPESKRK